jgi:tRNA A-37 threonylcarbamoyl transferase component Bud32
MTPDIRWLAGEPALRAALEPALRDPAAADLTLLREQPGRRRLERLRLASGELLFLKRFFGGSGRHPLREVLKSRLGLATARREWRALQRLHRAGVAVPEPLALASLPDGDFVLATRYLEGRTLKETMAAGVADRRRLIAAVGDLVASLHAAGTAHWDLHHGNILVTEEGAHLLDLQTTWPFRSSYARNRDLGELDHSLSAALSTPDRVRLRAQALGLARPFSAAARGRLRAVGRSSRARERAYSASRTRRALRAGRRYRHLQWRDYRGLRLRGVEEEAARTAFEAHRRAQESGAREGSRVLKRDGRSRITAVRVGDQRLVVKEYAPTGWLRRITDALRGSPARRAWLGGHGLLARRIGAATPVAFLERRRLGLAVGSIVALEDVHPLVPADRCGGELASPEQLADALVGLALALHRRGVLHGDLKASHVAVGREGDRLLTRLVDLEGVRFRHRLSDRRRLRELAELNASLPDFVPDAVRCRAFVRYAALLPFRRGRDTALRQLVAASLARAHRWSASGCAVARRLREGRAAAAASALKR